MSRNAPELAVSVVIPTHNPREDYLARVLDALRTQTLPREQWEVIVVDNGSRVPLKAGAGQQDNWSAGPQDCGTSLPSQIPTFPPSTAHLDLGWHGNATIVREEELGLTFARLRGFAEAKGELIVMVDDDNVLAPDYLETAVRIAQEHPSLGAFGGKCLPEFEVEPEPWLASVRSGLGLRDLGEAPQLFPEETGGGGQETGDRPSGSESLRVGEGQESGDRQPNTANRQRRAVREFPDCAPIGAGMVLRREAARAYAERLRRRSGLRVAGGESDGVRQEAEGIRHTADGECQGAGDRKQEPENGAERSETDWSEATAAQRDRRVARSNPDLPKDRNTEPRLGETALRQPPSHRAASVITDRRGDSLASGGDNDICLTVIEDGWQVGYLPQLELTHLIPKQRMTLDYHKRMARDSMKSFILMLDQHGIRPWPAMPKWTLPLRVASDWWRVKPWRGPEELLRFWGHLGMYEGRAALAAKQKPARSESSQ